MVGAEQHARHHAAHTGRCGLLAVAYKRTAAALAAQSHLYPTAIALEQQVCRRTVGTLAHQLGRRGTAKRLPRRQELQSLDEIRFSHRVATHEHRHGRIELKLELRKAPPVANAQRAREYSH